MNKWTLFLIFEICITHTRKPNTEAKVVIVPSSCHWQPWAWEGRSTTHVSLQSPSMCWTQPTVGSGSSPDAFCWVVISSPHQANTMCSMGWLQNHMVDQMAHLCAGILFMNISSCFSTRPWKRVSIGPYWCAMRHWSRVSFAFSLPMLPPVGVQEPTKSRRSANVCWGTIGENWQKGAVWWCSKLSCCQ